jgi:hypothetical protein
MVYIAKIYKIVNTINDDIYVGSTKNELYKRWYDHKRFAKKTPEQNGLYQMMVEHSIDCFRIVLIEEVECNNKSEQVRHEQRYIDMLKPKLNKNNASGHKCEHNRERSKCVDCNGSQICIHKKRRNRCVDCNGVSICIHKKIRNICVDCNGSGICIHKKQRHRCVDCNGSGICFHKKRRSECVDCNGSGICEHNKRRSRCIICGGRETQKVYCYDCTIEFKKNNSKIHYNSAKHLHNTLPFTS